MTPSILLAKSDAVPLLDIGIDILEVALKVAKTVVEDADAFELAKVKDKHGEYGWCWTGRYRITEKTYFFFMNRHEKERCSEIIKKELAELGFPESASELGRNAIPTIDQVLKDTLTLRILCDAAPELHLQIPMKMASVFKFAKLMKPVYDKAGAPAA